MTKKAKVVAVAGVLGLISIIILAAFCRKATRAVAEALDDGFEIGAC